ncbi:lysophospholipid acyltransferase family protein [bacterium]|nr:lysophospholipid acyltransferase family protein [bacterium]
MRIRLIDPNKVSPQARTEEKFIYAFWHNQQILSAFFFRNFGIRVLVSRSKDGDYITGVLKQFGFGAVRSSSSSGKINALRGLVKELRKGAHTAITPDGPRGPVYQAQPGVVFLAALSGHRVVPFGCAVNRVWSLRRAWDRFEIPKPFSRAVIFYGDPISVPKKLTDEAAKKIVQHVENEMNRLRTAAQQQVENPDESRHG